MDAVTVQNPEGAVLVSATTVGGPADRVSTVQSPDVVIFTGGFKVRRDSAEASTRAP
jgi:hypothetical protein